MQGPAIAISHRECLELEAEAGGEYVTCSGRDRLSPDFVTCEPRTSMTPKKLRWKPTWCPIIRSIRILYLRGENTIKPKIHQWRRLQHNFEGFNLSCTRKLQISFHTYYHFI